MSETKESAKVQYPYPIKIKRSTGEVYNALVTGVMPWVKEYGAKDDRLIARAYRNGLVSHGLLDDNETIIEGGKDA